MENVRLLTDKELEQLIARVSRGEKLTEQEGEELKEPLRRALRDGTLWNEIYETARPAIEADDRARRYDGESGRYRI